MVIRCAPAALGYEPGAGSVAGTAPAAAAAASASEAQGAPAAGSGGGGGGGPLGSGGRLVLSFERGIEWDTNTSRRYGTNRALSRPVVECGPLVFAPDLPLKCIPLAMTTVRCRRLDTPGLECCIPAMGVELAV